MLLCILLISAHNENVRLLETIIVFYMKLILQIIDFLQCTLKTKNELNFKVTKRNLKNVNQIKILLFLTPFLTVDWFILQKEIELHMVYTLH